jgi:predicted PurR-regulated permease PerM
MSETERAARQRPLFYALVLLALYLTYLVLGPFLGVLAWAGIFAILFYRVHLRLAARLGPSWAALVTTVLAGVVIVVPAALLVSALVHEVPQATAYLQQMSRSVPTQIERLWAWLRGQSPVVLPQDPTELLTEGARRAFAFLAPRAGAILADAFATLGALAAMLFALFFMLRDGDAMSLALRALLPLPADESARLLRDTRELVVASVGAGLLVAAAQGVIGGVAFWMLGLGAPVLWGVAIAFCSLIPLVGSALVWLPATVWLLASGEITRGVIMLLVGVLGIGLVDNILRPLVLSGRTSVSGLVVFFGLLGGVAAFGFIGLVIGPIVLVITGSLLRLLSRPDRADPAH